MLAVFHPSGTVTNQIFLSPLNRRLFYFPFTSLTNPPKAGKATTNNLSQSFIEVQLSVSKSINTNAETREVAAPNKVAILLRDCLVMILQKPDFYSVPD